MIRRKLAMGVAIWLAALWVPSAGVTAGPTAQELLGRQMPDFSLPSTEGRLTGYERDHYGQHHLVLTFFPAAFTPV